MKTFTIIRRFLNIFLVIALCRIAYAENLLAELQSSYTNVLIERVIQADRVVLSTGEKVRLIGIRAPEPPPKEKVERNEFGFVIEPPVTPETAIEEQAIRLARELMEKQRVRLEFDIQKKSESYETLAYVFLEDGRMVNTEILRQGLANLQLQAPNLKYEELFRAAYREARQEKRGLLAD